MTKTKVAVVRHGEKMKNFQGIEHLTLKGMAQIAETCTAVDRIFPIGNILYSGVERTLQCATIAQFVLSLNFSPVCTNSGLSVEKLLKEIFDNDFDVFIKEYTAIKKAGNTLKAGLEISTYVRQARAQMVNTVFEIAKSGDAICFSHSPLSSFASPDTNFPYDIGVADAIIYTVSDTRIVSAEHILCPF